MSHVTEAIVLHTEPERSKHRKDIAIRLTEPSDYEAVRTILQDNSDFSATFYEGGADK
jgi:hypothetical protein